MRKYRPEFVEKEMQKMYNLKDEIDSKHFPLLPDFSEKPWLDKQVKEVLDHRGKLSYMQGFWYGFCLGLGNPE